MEKIAEIVLDIQRERDLLNQAIAALAPLTGTTVVKPNGGAESSMQDIESRIRQRAQELCEIRGREDGHELDDWLQAEKEILGVAKVYAAAA